MSQPLPDTPETPDLQALAALRPALVRFFRRRCGSLAQAEDLAQEVLVKTLGRARWTVPAQAKGYVFRAAVNLWHDQRRRQVTQGQAEVGWEDDVALSVVEEIPLERVLQSEEELYHVHAALLELSERTRDIFVLNRLEQLTYAAIAETFGISVSAVEKHMSKALAHLARYLKEHDTP